MSKLKIILIIVLVVAIVLLAIFWILARQDKDDEVILPDIVDQNQDVQPEPTPKPKVTRPQISEEDRLKAQLQKMSTAFVERFGSYSNQSDFENLEDLKPFMSRGFKIWTDDFVSENRKQADETAIYYGITTKSLKATLIDFSSFSVKFKISTQRQEVFGASVNSNVYYQDIDMELVNEAGVWKVDKAIWQ